MSVLTALGIGMSVASGVSGILGSQKSKKEAKKMAGIQRELATREYNINLNILGENFVNNALVNFDSIARKMSDLTSQYTEARNNSLMATASYFSGGASYNSNRENTIATLNLDYNSKVFEYNNLRVYNEETIKKQFTNDVLNLGSRYNNTMYGISTNLYQANKAADQSALNSLLSAGASIFGMLGYTEASQAGNTSVFREIPKAEWLG